MQTQNSFHPDYLGEVARRLKLRPYPHVRQFVIQHLFADTVRLLKLLHSYVPIDVVIGISYSGNQASIDELRSLGIEVITPSYKELESIVLKTLKRRIEKAKNEDHKLILHEVGGYGIKALHTPNNICDGVFIGALEITKQGVWVAEALPNLSIPQFNVAQTRLKEIEGKLVGEAVVAALDTIMREVGYAFVGRPALVCGYGWVGKGVAQSLKNKGMSVAVRDTDVVSLVEAAVDGFLPNRGNVLELPPAIVVGASGHCSIDSRLMDQLPHRCVLASGASKNHEIELPYLESNCSTSTQIHPHIIEYKLRDQRTLYLVNNGFPVNFTSASVPDEIVEFLFAECMMLVPLLLENTWEPGTYTLPAEQEALPAEVWLDMR